MPGSKNSFFPLLGIITAGALALVFVILKASAQNVYIFLIVGALYLLCTLLFLRLYNLNRKNEIEKNRLEMEQRLSFLVQDIKDYAIFLIDPGGRVMSWNKGAQQIKGYSEEEILGKPISVFYTDEENQLGEPALNLQRALEDGRYESIGLRKRKDGSTFYADVVFTPIFDDKGDLKGFAKITRDITEQKRAEEDMQNTLRREKELNEMKSRFVTLASHEFKTPLSVILSSVSLIEKYQEPGMEDKRLKHIHRIRSNVENLKLILDDFLSLEKLESGIVKNCPVETDLVHFAEDTIQDMETTLKGGQQIHLHIEGSQRAIFVDNQLLRNVLYNLLSNAIKYSPENTPVDFVLSFRPDDLEIRVKDSGLGIPPEEQYQLFERFFRATNTTGIAGTGLGLSIVKRYLDLMGGRIRVNSAPGQGSTFTTTLPG